MDTPWHDPQPRICRADTPAGCRPVSLRVGTTTVGAYLPDPPIPATLTTYYTAPINRSPDTFTTLPGPGHVTAAASSAQAAWFPNGTIDGAGEWVLGAITARTAAAATASEPFTAGPPADFPGDLHMGRAEGITVRLTAAAHSRNPVRWAAAATARRGRSIWVTIGAGAGATVASLADSAWNDCAPADEYMYWLTVGGTHGLTGPIVGTAYGAADSGWTGPLPGAAAEQLPAADILTPGARLHATFGMISEYHYIGRVLPNRPG